MYMDTVIMSLQRYGGSKGEEKEVELFVDVKQVEMVGTDMINKKLRYIWGDYKTMAYSCVRMNKSSNLYKLYSL